MTKCDFCRYSKYIDGKLICTFTKDSINYGFCDQAIKSMKETLENLIFPHLISEIK